MDILILLAIFSGIASTTSVFISIYLLLIQKGSQLGRLLLAGVLISVAMRITKSILYYLMDIPLVSTALGFFGQTNIGVFTFLYAYHVIYNKAWNKREYWLFVPSVIGFFCIWPYPAIAPWNTYLAGNIISLGFVIAALVLLVKNKQLKSSNARGWFYTLVGAVFVIVLMFTLQLFANTLERYALSAAVAACGVYYLFFVFLKTNPPFQLKPSTSDIQGIVDKIDSCMLVGKLYRQNSLTINDMSEELDEPVYKLSKVMNQHYGKKFPELVNSFRVREVQQLLTDPSNHHLKIESLAYEVGFNTPSSFYVAFKKETGMTPNQYRKSCADTKMAETKLRTA